MHAGTAIERAAGLMNPGDLLGQSGVLLGPLAEPPVSPSIEPGTGDPVEAAHHCDLVGFPVCFDEFEDFRF